MGYWQSWQRFFGMAIATGVLTLGFGLRSEARTPATAPASLTDLLVDIDQAANDQQLEQLLNFYGENFTHSDGLSKTDLQDLLTQLWEEYPRLSYNTKLLNWEQTGDRLVAETETQVRGLKKQAGRWVHYESTIRSQQTFQGDKLISQDILSEASTLTSGDNPPALKVLIPETVAPAADFGFDVIVQDPLGEEILLGGALEEPITSSTYTNPEAFDLDILPAGGIFKRVEAPTEAGDMWYSALVVRSDGMVLTTHRVKVEEAPLQANGL
ncbi:hypothetical protein FEK30_02575 [Picosynechococcus sp. PCC 11901]|uniref:hypothetical protein n=1 Tax=Picosynechococcus sp. PCC 11901 TaxID=2579791 RepID=UPI0010FBC7CC|nr:hypothetical protein [Picosynechococcus sp. PCC 11901]QCS48412.1 hypothetical protein FEK30_02575 [Picosynechococcus sp. PCC 11901]